MNLVQIANVMSYFVMTITDPRDKEFIISNMQEVFELSKSESENLYEHLEHLWLTLKPEDINNVQEKL